MILENKIVMTRTPHRCVWCNKEIPKESKCLVWVWAEGSEIQRNYSHTACANVAHLLECDEDDEVFSEYLQDAIVDVYHENIHKLPENFNQLSIERQCQCILDMQNELVL